MYDVFAWLSLGVSIFGCANATWRVAVSTQSGFLTSVAVVTAVVTNSPAVAVAGLVLGWWG